MQNILKLDLILQIIEVMKEELDGKIMTKFVEFRAKTYSYLIDEGNEDKKTKTLNKVGQEKII